MILDATAGNRTMWQHKNSQNIIYIDIEKKLWIKPTIFCDNTKTPFLPSTFGTIFYDPPHRYGDEPFDFKFGHLAVHRQALRHKPFGHTYYGWDKYKTKRQLIHHIYYAAKEFMRILKDDGVLWLKWCEVCITLNRVLSIFADWRILMIINVADPTHTMGKGKTYWVCMCKKNMDATQIRLG